MIEWPTLDELKQVLDVTSDDWDGAETSAEGATRLSRLLEAAIAHVKQEAGPWDEDLDFPDAELATAALRMAELMALKPELAAALRAGGVIRDPTYELLMYGKHRSFGVS